MSRFIYARNDTTYKSFIMSGGRCLGFDPNGGCIGFVDVPIEIINRPREVDIISILQFKDGCELAVNVNGSFVVLDTHNKTTPDVLDIVTKTFAPLNMGTRRGKTMNGVSWQQLILIFAVNTVNLGILRSLL